MSIRILELQSERETFALKYPEGIGLIEKMPVIMRVNGLAAAMAFCKTKDKSLHDYCSKWLKEYQSQFQVFEAGRFEDPNRFVEDLIALKDARLHFLAMKELDALFGAFKTKHFKPTLMSQPNQPLVTQEGTFIVQKAKKGKLVLKFEYIKTTGKKSGQPGVLTFSNVHSINSDWHNQKGKVETLGGVAQRAELESGELILSVQPQTKENNSSTSIFASGL